MWLEHLLGRLARLAVEREDRHVAAVIFGVWRLDHVVLQVRAIAVLRPEDRGELEAIGAAQSIGHVAEVMVDGGRVGEDADAKAVEAG